MTFPEGTVNDVHDIRVVKLGAVVNGGGVPKKRDCGPDVARLGRTGG